jgi:hypothetical protein
MHGCYAAGARRVFLEQEVQEEEVDKTVEVDDIHAGVSVEHRQPHILRRPGRRLRVADVHRVAVGAELLPIAVDVQQEPVRVVRVAVVVTK